MEKAPVIQEFTVKGFEDVTAGIVKWPLSVIRLQSEDVTRVIDLADHILQAWRGYTDEAAFIFAETDGQPHNTITPIARMRDGKYELDLTLRNNITTEEHPLGVYHPHKELHHIKKENIGLIEVMGLAVLPARLKDELELLKTYILEKKTSEAMRPLQSTRTGPKVSYRPIRRSTQKMSRIFWNRKSERSSVRSWKMPVFTNAQTKDSLHLTDLLRLYKIDFGKQ